MASIRLHRRLAPAITGLIGEIYTVTKDTDEPRFDVTIKSPCGDVYIRFTKAELDFIMEGVKGE